MEVRKCRGGPGLLQSRLMRLLCKLNYLPKLTVVYDRRGVQVVAVYRVFETYWSDQKTTRVFKAFPVKRVTLNGRLQRSTKDRTYFDKITIDASSGKGRVELNKPQTED